MRSLRLARAAALLLLVATSLAAQTQQSASPASQSSDPRATGNGEVFESYPRYSPIRKFE